MEFELVSVSTGTAVPGRVLWAFRAPDQFRLEGADPNLDRADGSFDQTVLIRDGSSAWWYHPRTNEYVILASDQLPDKGNPESFVAMAIGRFREAGHSPGRFLREELLEVKGAKVACYVVSLTGHNSGGRHKRSHLVGRGEEQPHCARRRRRRFKRRVRNGQAQRIGAG